MKSKISYNYWYKLQFNFYLDTLTNLICPILKTKVTTLKFRYFGQESPLITKREPLLSWGFREGAMTPFESRGEELRNLFHDAKRLTRLGGGI